MSFSSMLAMASGASKAPEANASATDKPKKPLNVARPISNSINHTKPASTSSSPPRTSPMPQSQRPTQPIKVSQPVSSSTNSKERLLSTSKPAAKPVTKPGIKPSAKPGLKPTQRPDTSSIGKKAAPPSPKDCGKKKISFSDIMKQAEKVDTNKLKVTVNTRDKKTPPVKRKPKGAEGSSPVPKEVSPAAASRSTTASPVRSNPTSRSGSKAPAPAAQPFPELQEKLRKRKNTKQEHDSDLEDFVVEDEDEGPAEHTSYRDEIWGMFNRRSYDDYCDDDSSDMEATGAEIFAEENRSRKEGAREDQREEKRLQDLALQKKRRKMGHA